MKGSNSTECSKITLMKCSRLRIQIKEMLQLLSNNYIQRLFIICWPELLLIILVAAIFDSLLNKLIHTF